MNKIIVICFILVFGIEAKEKHLLNDIEYKSGSYCNMVIEIPAGTTAKYEVNKRSGKIEQEYVNGQKRVVEFLPYPGNYGFIPQTILLKEKGGDNDPIDVLLISESKARGSVQSIKIIGALDFDDRGESDTKLLAVPKNGDFSQINTLEEMFLEYPNMINIINLWFQGYKGPEKMHFTGFITKDTLLKMIEESHLDWRK